MPHYKHQHNTTLTNFNECTGRERDIQIIISIPINSYFHTQTNAYIIKK